MKSEVKGIQCWHKKTYKPLNAFCKPTAELSQEYAVHILLELATVTMKLQSSRLFFNHYL